MLYTHVNSCRDRAYLISYRLFLLVSVLPEALLTLVRSHLVFLSFLSARHMNVLIVLSALRGMIFNLF